MKTLLSTSQRTPGTIFSIYILYPLNLVCFKENPGDRSLSRKVMSIDFQKTVPHPTDIEWGISEKFLEKRGVRNMPCLMVVISHHIIRECNFFGYKKLNVKRVSRHATQWRRQVWKRKTMVENSETDVYAVRNDIELMLVRQET
jgi:hypothetical protein